METKITPDELAERLTAVLEQINATGERFIIERDGQRLAELAPPTNHPSPTVADFFALLDRLPRPDDRFADDLALVQATQPLAESPEWPD